jgi:hypothetical protein
MNEKTIVVQQILQKTDKITEHAMKALNLPYNMRPHLRSFLMGLFVYEFNQSFSSLKDLMIEIGDEYDRKSPEDFKIHLSQMAKKINSFSQIPETDITDELEKHV